MTDLKYAFALARAILAEDAERGLTATFAEKRRLYRMACRGSVVWRSFSGPSGLSVAAYSTKEGGSGLVLMQAGVAYDVYAPGQ